MPNPTIISCAVTGGADTKSINPAVPVSPTEIAAEAMDAYDAGAAIVHIHVRDPETGKATPDPEKNARLFEETTEEIRKSGSKVILNLTTGWGGVIGVNQNNPVEPAPGSRLKTAGERVAHVLSCQPDICSLDVATMNFGQGTMINSIEILAAMGKAVQAAGVKPEIEAFDTGHVRLANDLFKKGILSDDRPLYQLCLGIPWGAAASIESLLTMKNLVPENAVWSAFGISATEFPMVAAAAISGGNVRVGLEDNLYVARGELASGNRVLVARAVSIIEAVGGQVASVEEARKLLNL
mgnify:CR=1 FL=1